MLFTELELIFIIQNHEKRRQKKIINHRNSYYGDYLRIFRKILKFKTNKIMNATRKLKTKIKRELKAAYKKYPVSVTVIYEDLKSQSNIMDCAFSTILSIDAFCKSVNMEYPLSTFLKK